MSDSKTRPANDEKLRTGHSGRNGRVAELSRADCDFGSSLESTRIASVFLDRDLAIKSFTSGAKDILRLVESDIGRPITHIGAHFHFDSIRADAERVIRTISTIEYRLESRDNDSRYFMHMMPCRTIGNLVAGVVITFVDITRITAAEQHINGLAHDLGNRDTGGRISILSTSGNSTPGHPLAISTTSDSDAFPQGPDTELNYGNVLLDSLDVADRALLLPSLELVELPEGALRDAETQIYFPINCLISTRLARSSGKQIELRSVSRHSATLAEMLYGDPGKVTSVVMVSGKSWRISLEALRALIESDRDLRTKILADLRSAMGEYAENIFLVGRATIVERTARWLVLTCSALEIEVLHLKHEALAEVLGVHRPSITIALQTLEGLGLIRSTRRSILIRDMRGLETLAKWIRGANPESKVAVASAQ